MRITIVQGAFLPVPPLMGGAVEKVWQALGEEFVRRGHEVTHISRAFEGLPQKEVRAGVQHKRVRGFNTPRSLALLKALDLLYSTRTLAAIPRSDILVTNTFWLPVLIRSEKRGRLYVHVGRYPKGQMRLYRHAARLQTVSTPIAHAIRSQAPEVSSKVRTIAYPLPPSAFTAEGGRDLPREPVLLFVGRLHPEKGINLLIQACATSAAFLEGGWRLRIVGPWESRHGGGGATYKREVETLAQSLGNRVELVGPIFESGLLNREYRQAKLFAYPSLAEKGETFGLAPLEAMAAGCPPLVSDLACFGDFLRDSITGFVFNHRGTDPVAEFSNKLNQVLTDGAQLKQIAKNAESKAQEFRIENVATSYLDDFASLLT